MHVELAPYRCGVLVSVGQSRGRLRRSLLDADRAYGTARADVVLKEFDEHDGPGFCLKFGRDSVIVLREMPMTVQQQGIVVHECLHAVHGAIGDIGISLEDRSGEEAYAYLLEHLFTSIMSRVAERVK